MDPPGLPTNETGTSANPQQPNQANPPLGPQQPANHGITQDQLGQFMNTVNQALNQLAIRVEELSAERSPPGYGRAPLNQRQAGYEQAYPGQGSNQTVQAGQPGLQNPDPQVPLNQGVPPPPPNPPAPRQPMAPPLDAVATWLQAQPPQIQGQNAPHGEIPFAPPNYAASHAGATVAQPEENGEIIKLREHVQNIERMMGERKDDLAELHNYPLYPEAKMPPGFKRSAIDKFDGKGSPRNHIVSYVRTMQMCECGEPEMALCFHLSLVGSAQKWFLGLDKHRVSTWASIVREFMARYKNNEELEITRKHLQMTKQGEKESFGDFVNRFRDLAAQMVDCPKEEDLIEMILENFTPAVRESLVNSYIPHFKALLTVGAQVENALARKAATEPKKIGSQYTSKNPATSMVHNISSTPPPFTFPNNNPPPYLASPRALNWAAQAGERLQRNRQQRNFSRLPGPLGRTFEHLRAAGLLQPLPPRSPNDPPMGINLNARCHFHQAQGHETDGCFALRRAIQDLIDNKSIPNPEVPNIAHNPLPNHEAGPRINALITEEETGDPMHLIRAKGDTCCAMEQFMSKKATPKSWRKKVGDMIWAEIDRAPHY